MKKKTGLRKSPLTQNRMSSYGLGLESTWGGLRCLKVYTRLTVLNPCLKFNP